MSCKCATIQCVHFAMALLNFNVAKWPVVQLYSRESLYRGLGPKRKATMQCYHVKREGCIRQYSPVNFIIKDKVHRTLYIKVYYSLCVNTLANMDLAEAKHFKYASNSLCLLGQVDNSYYIIYCIHKWYFNNSPYVARFC